MIHIGVIGLGSIYKTQKKVLEMLSDRYEVVATYDVKKETEPTCDSLDSFLSTTPMEAVLIAIPPKEHYVVAKRCIEAGKHVLLEKPAVLSMDELNELYLAADEKKVILHIAFHAAFAIDLEWFLRNKENLATQYGLRKIKRITCGFFDPYCADSIAKQGKSSLEGSYVDSGVNALSVCERLADISEFESEHHETDFDMNHIVTSSKTVYSNKDKSREWVIYTGWNRDLNYKCCLLEFEDSGQMVFLEHSRQRVLLLNDFHDPKNPIDDENKDYEVLFEDISLPRLECHYKGVFGDFEKSLKTRVSNKKKALEVHRLLLTNV